VEIRIRFPVHGKADVSAVFIQTRLNSVFCSGFIVMAISQMLISISMLKGVAIWRKM
jgi:hypothetical protein